MTATISIERLIEDLKKIKGQFNKDYIVDEEVRKNIKDNHV